MSTTHDSHLVKMDAAAGQTGHDVSDPAESALPEPMIGVPVRDEAAALGNWRVVKLSGANPVKQLLPQDPHRRSAVVLAVDNDVYVASSPELAGNDQGTTTGSSGFYLPKGVPIPVRNKAACYAAATTVASVSRVSVLVERNDELCPALSASPPATR